MTYLGIDPGQSGGIAWITGIRAAAEKMPESETDILELLNDIAREGPCYAVLERVNAFPGQGVTSSFNFGMGFGGLKMALSACKIPYVLVPPATWQRRLGCLTKGNKNVTKNVAQARWPELKITHATADALLIATFAMQTHKNWQA